MTDNVNHPAHYNVAGYEVIDIIQAFTDGLDSMDAYETGNIIKYILRWPHKNGLEDLQKARWYLNHLIARKEAEEAWGEEDDQDVIMWSGDIPCKTEQTESCSVMEDEESKKEMLRDWLKEMAGKGVRINELEEQYGKGNND